ncbi:hypothetical protein E2C01_056701 [Portunus trituberculatus]|uniref:Uncharacterized protein n=1 Tax=Portunus trituberculatus TaxID=210409 RepID=A0A5B7GR18_PORTR|nr:hypothetical protein [Portunus trituberculatus]
MRTHPETQHDQGDQRARSGHHAHSPHPLPHQSLRQQQAAAPPPGHLMLLAQAAGGGGDGRGVAPCGAHVCPLLVGQAHGAGLHLLLARLAGLVKPPDDMLGAGRPAHLLPPADHAAPAAPERVLVVVERRQVCGGVVGEALLLSGVGQALPRHQYLLLLVVAVPHRLARAVLTGQASLGGTSAPRRLGEIYAGLRLWAQDASVLHQMSQGLVGGEGVALVNAVGVAPPRRVRRPSAAATRILLGTAGVRAVRPAVSTASRGNLAFLRYRDVGVSGRVGIRASLARGLVGCPGVGVGLIRGTLAGLVGGPVAGVQGIAGVLCQILLEGGGVVGLGEGEVVLARAIGVAGHRGRHVVLRVRVPGGGVPGLGPPLGVVMGVPHGAGGGRSGRCHTPSPRRRSWPQPRLLARAAVRRHAPHAAPPPAATPTGSRVAGGRPEAELRRRRALWALLPHSRLAPGGTESEARPLGARCRSVALSPRPDTLCSLRACVCARACVRPAAPLLRPHPPSIPPPPPPAAAPLPRPY